MAAQKISSPADLKQIREQFQASTEMRGAAKEITVTVHMGTCGIAAGARDVLRCLAEELITAKSENVTVRQSGCVGRCGAEPMFTVKGPKDASWVYGSLDQAKVREIVREHLVGGQPVERLVVRG